MRKIVLKTILVAKSIKQENYIKQF